VLPKGKAALIVVPALGGAERQLGEINVTWFIAGPDFGSGASWSLDSASIIVTDNPSPTEPGGLFAWSVATGERRRLTTSPKSSLDISSALSPDGRTLAFTRFAGFGISDVYVLPVGAQLQPIGDPRRVTYDNRFATSPAWMPDGREILFTSGSLTSAVAGLFAVNPTRADGRGATTRSLGIADHAGPASISHPPGAGRSRMVYVESHFDTGIWRIELPRAQNAPSGAAPASVPFILSTRPEYQPHYSLDGQKVAFVSASSGISEIWTCDNNGANLAQLTSSAWPETASPRWSPDGSQIAFHARPEGGGDIYTIPATGGPPKRITDGQGDPWRASWSPDGQWVYFTSNRSGRQEIWKAPAAGGGSAVQVTRNGGFGPTASSEGRYVYYAKGVELWRLPLNGGDESRVLGSLSDWSRLVPTVDGVYFVAGPPPPMKPSDEYSIAFLQFADQQITTIARLDKPPFLGLTLSPDGRWLLYSQIDQSGTDLMLVDSIR
jgi:Tol biopolymer transport system component